MEGHTTSWFVGNSSLAADSTERPHEALILPLKTLTLVARVLLASSRSESMLLWVFHGRPGRALRRPLP